ncbi:MAG: hypothetical protein IKN36_05470 [Clostridia bacterium]|nr:hypothetical protein [Clostridia bacterium]
MINYAHQGASFYAPGNTLSSFYTALAMGADGLDADVRRAGDGTLVLFQDKTLDSLSDGSGTLSDRTLPELTGVRVEGNSTNGFRDFIVTLREFFEHFTRYDVCFLLNLAEPGVAEDAMKTAAQFGVTERTVFASALAENVRRVKEIDPSARVSLIVREGTDEEVRFLREIGGEEIAVLYKGITSEFIKPWRAAGLAVRAWGAKSPFGMKRVCRLGIDSASVDFPDRLYEFLHCEHLFSEKEAGK